MSPAKKRVEKPPYHHGDLHQALLEAGEKVLRREGVAGLGMRAVTREAGVSHTAAKPHFGSLDGLRAGIAALGYQRLATALEAAQAQPGPLRARRLAIARAYLHFAVEHTALFELMFRRELVDMKDPALLAATARAMGALAGPIALQASADSIGRDGAIRMSASWAFVHGLAGLVVEKRLRGVQKRAPDFPDLMTLAEAVLENVSLKFEQE